MTITCTINFENNSKKVFYSGELIRGNVRLALTERKKVRGVYIRFNGDAHTEWSESVREEQGSGDDRKYVDVLKYYRGHENYLNSRIFLIGDNSGEMYLKAGENNFNFAYRLPTNIPSSFSGTYGNIKYNATVVVVIPWWLDDKFKQSITILKSVDLNNNLILHRPVTKAKEHNYYPCCLLFCFPSDPLKINVKIPVGGYVPGQIIKLTLTADNESNRRIPSFKTKLIQEITYYAENKIQTERFSTPGDKSTRGVETNQKRVIYLNLLVSSYPASDVINCDIIKIRYYLVIKADSGTICNNPKIEMPITIGTHPINNFDDRTQGDSVVTIQPSAPREDDMPDDIAPPNPVDGEFFQ